MFVSNYFRLQQNDFDPFINDPMIQLLSFPAKTQLPLWLKHVALFGPQTQTCPMQSNMFQSEWQLCFVREGE